MFEVIRNGKRARSESISLRCRSEVDFGCVHIGQLNLFLGVAMGNAGGIVVDYTVDRLSIF